MAQVSRKNYDRRMNEMMEERKRGKPLEKPPNKWMDNADVVMQQLREKIMRKAYGLPFGYL